MIYYMDNVTNEQCRDILDRLELLVFTDYQLVYKFVEHCEADIQRLRCGRTVSGDDERKVHTLQVLVAAVVSYDVIGKLVYFLQLSFLCVEDSHRSHQC